MFSGGVIGCYEDTATAPDLTNLVFTDSLLHQNACAGICFLKVRYGIYKQNHPLQTISRTTYKIITGYCFVTDYCIITGYGFTTG